MTEFFASWSGGKDSTASIILAHEHGEPLDGIVFAEVMFDKDISGELPEHIKYTNAKSSSKHGAIQSIFCEAIQIILTAFITSTQRASAKGKGRVFQWLASV